MHLNLIIFLIPAFATLFPVAAFPQKKTLVGINAIFESTSGPLRPGIGLTVERQITRHSGIESGLYHRNHVSTQYLLIGSPGGGLSPATLTISERFLSIPVLYKYYSRILNAGIGPTFEFYTGWRQKNKTGGLTVNDYSIDPNFSMGIMLKISKHIPVSSRLSIEPEIRYNLVWTFEREYAGFGVAAKYKLR